MSETLLDRALIDVCHALDTRGIAFALVGGLAVSLRAEVRFTRDIDFALSVTENAEVELLVRELQAMGYKVKALIEQDAQHRLATVRLVAPTGVPVDLLTASSGIEPELVKRAELVIWNTECSLHVARREELLALKVLSVTERRPQDLTDVRALLKAGVDHATVEGNLAEIQARGFHRKQDLLAKYRQLVAEM